MALGLDAYVVAGIIPVISGDLHASISATGQLVAVFTLSYALLAPICATLVTGRPMRTVLLAALLIFTFGNVLGALAPSLGVLMLSRVVCGFGAGLYSPMSAATAVALAPAQRRGRALSMILGGMSAGTVVGVPIGLTLAHHTGWRSTLWLVSGIGAVALVAVAATLPEVPEAAIPTLRARISVLTDRKVLSIVAITVFCSGASLGMYTYIAPLFSSTLGVSNLTGYLWIWGLGGLVGSFAVGTLIDRWRNTRLLLSLILLLLGAALVLLSTIGRSTAGAVVLLLVWGATGWSSLAPQQHRLVALRPGEGPIAVSLNASVLYLGSAIGAVVGGSLLAAGYSVTTLPYVFGIAAVVASAANILVTAPTGSQSTATPAAATTPGAAAAVAPEASIEA
ncbi:MAG TPA: MFS transporter [Actinocrinis sp.]|nr:MFS transporter [Actinocrinis sp.]